MRRDAEARREALLLAARDCFQKAGYWVPLEEVAALAGTGRGTLYRNFPDRLSLATAVFEREIALLTREGPAEAGTAEGLERFVLKAARPAALAHRLALDLAAEPGHAAAQETLRARGTALWQPILVQSQAAGLLRAGIGPAEIMALTGLLGGLVAPSDDDDTIERRVLPVWRLIMDGLRPR